ncbi:hypothetical protein TSUD_29920 [Trifolium subterraneum]|uniref:RNase H type-1 domain-containing protein n=1 Tax=Trifolium subterraneum TaxID=3900 RepID=A0A2Z6MV46_TRISU|nr:hypothetical protein TSUD_29920 [Trifolium subterraneum]
MAELCGVIRAIEIADSKNWNNLWLEIHSSLLVLVLKSSALVPWSLSNRGMNCVRLARNRNFLASHVYREGNQCTDGLANIGLTIDRLTIWYDTPPQILSCFVDNRLDKPSYRFVI